MIDTGTYLSPSEAARRLGLSTIRVRQICDAGSLTCVRTPLGRLIPAADLERFAAERDARKLVAAQ